MSRMVRVLIVDDSPTTQALLRALLETDHSICVIGTASDGRQAVEKTLLLKPDLITMDLQMPVMDGFEATERIMELRPTPIVVVSAGLGSPELEFSFRALKVGALDVIRKPVGSSHQDYEIIREQLVSVVRNMAEVRVVRRRPIGLGRTGVNSLEGSGEVLIASRRKAPGVLAIGSSTGGPAVLNAIFKALPPTFSIPILVVQHMTIGFTSGLVDWLRHESGLPIDIATDGHAFKPGRITVAPDDVHMILRDRSRIGLLPGEKVSFVRPSATLLFESVAHTFGADSLGILLTGMGDDGARGLSAIRDAGGTTIAQDEASCVVFGMPRAAIERHAAQYVLSPAEIVDYLKRMMIG